MPDYNININANVKSAADGFKQAAGHVDNFEKGIQRLQRSLQAFVGLYIFRQLAQGAGEAVKQVANLEDAMVGVSRTTGLSGDALNKLQDQFTELSTQIPKTAQELAQIGFVAGQLGITGSANIEKFVGTIARVTMVTKMSADQAATSFAKTAAALRMPISDVGKLASAMLYLETSSSASTEEILSASQKMSGMAFSAGVSAAGVLALSTALIESGVQAGKAGTLMGTVFQKMGERYKDVARQMGVDAGEWKKKVETDMLGALMEYLSFLNTVPSSVDRVGLSFQVFGQLGDRVTLSLIDKIDRLKTLYAETGVEISSENRLLDQSNQITETLSSQWTILTSEVNKFVLDSDLLKFLKDIVGVLRESIPLLESYANFINSISVFGIIADAQSRRLKNTESDVNKGYIKNTDFPMQMSTAFANMESGSTQGVMSDVNPLDSIFGSEMEASERVEYTKAALADLENFQRDLANQRFQRTLAEFESMKSLTTTLISYQKTGWQTIFDFMNMGIKTFSSSMTTALTGIITGTMKAGEAFKQFGKTMIAAIVAFFVQWAIQSLISMALSKVMTAASVKEAAALADAWVLPAFFKSIVDPSAPLVAAGSMGLGLGLVKGLGGALSSPKGAASGGGESMNFGGGSAELPMGFMAQGGLISEPTLAIGTRSGKMNMIGEAGPESVIPMNDRGSSSSSNNAIQVAININTPFSADDRIFWDNVAREYIVPAIERNSGREVA